MYHQSLTRKRHNRSSPFPSPQRLTRSPAGKMRRPRTGTERPDSSEPPPSTSTSSYSFGPMCRQVVIANKQLSDFLKNEHEISAISELQEELHPYILQKVALAGSESGRTLLSMQDSLSLTRTTHTERSNVLYLNVMDAKSDSKVRKPRMAIHVHIHIRVPFHVHVHFYVQFHVHVHVRSLFLRVTSLLCACALSRSGGGGGGTVLCRLLDRLVNIRF